MKIVCYYNKILNMTPEELSSQVGLFCMKLYDFYGVDVPYEDNTIIVKGLNNTEFLNMKDCLEKDNKEVFTGVVEVVFGYVIWE